MPIRRARLIWVVAIGVALVAAWFYIHRPISAVDREAARTAAIRLLTADTAVGQMPADLDERKRIFETQADERRAALAKVWTPVVLPSHVRDWEDGIGAFHFDSTYEAYTDSRFVVAEWRTVKRVIGGIQVVVRGHMAYKDAESGEWVGSTEGTEHLTMTRVTGEWRLVRETVSDYYP